MAKMKNCKDCGSEISKSAKVCPHCGKKQGHPVLRFILGFFIIIIGFGAIIGGTSNNPDSSITANASVVTKENYNKISEGMTKKEVKKILGEPASVSENENPGIGTMELNHYQEPFSFIGIDIYYLNGKVYMKNYTEL